MLSCYNNERKNGPIDTMATKPLTLDSLGPEAFSRQSIPPK